MDMSNATAAGPSRGFLDILFGSKAEETPADGQSFGGLMDLIKALKEKKEELSAEMSRTQGETMSGKNGRDAPVAGMPGMMNAAAENSQAMLILPMPEMGAGSVSAEDEEKKERLARLSMLLGHPATAAPLPASPVQGQEGAPLEALRADQVNQALQQKSLPPLTPEEQKLLSEVNRKIEQVNVGQQPMEAALPAPVGIDSRKLKAKEISAESGTPEKLTSAEKLMSTETYLQMHGNMQKPSVAKQPDAGTLAQNPGENPAAAGKAAGALTAAAVAGLGEKHGGAKAAKEGEEGSEPGIKQDAPAGSAFGSLLAQQSGETLRHDIYLPGKDRPEELRRALVGELGSGVALNVGKGGGEMRLVLHPDDMGEVKLKVGTKNGKVEVEVVAENEATAKLIRAGSKDLEQSLKDQNLSLAKLEVTVSDPSKVTSLDNKTNLTDQFLSQQQQPPQYSGFSSGMNGDDGRNSRWTGDHGGRPSPGYAQGEDSGRSSARSAGFAPRQAARDSSRRLDVVA